MLASFFMRKNPFAVPALLALAFCFSAGEKSQCKLDEGPASYLVDNNLQELLHGASGERLGSKKEKLRKFLSGAASERAKKKAAYILARILQKEGGTAELKEARPLFEEAAGFPPLQERSLWHLVEIGSKSGDEILVRQSLEKLLLKAGKSKAAAQAHYGLAQSYLRSSEKEKADAAFALVLKNYPDSQFAVGSRYYLGQAALRENKIAEALGQWRSYLAQSADGRFALEIVQTLKKPEFTLEENDQKLIADVYFAAGRWQDALDAWKLVPAYDPGWYKRGLCLIRAGKKSEGKEVFLEGIKKNPKDPKVLDAAKLLAYLGSREEAISVWKMVLEEAPAQEESALYNLAIRSSDDDLQAQLFEDFLAKYPDSDFAPEACWWLAWHRIKAGNLSKALADLKTGAPRYESSRAGPRLSFWLAKLEEKLNHKQEARKAYEDTLKKFPWHYYGFRAESRIAALDGKGDRLWHTNESGAQSLYARLKAAGGWSYPMPPKLVPYTQIASQGGQSLACLAELEQWDECLELVPEKTLPQLKSLCLAKLNLPMESINEAARGLKNPFVEALRWQLAYPLSHFDIVGSESQAKHIDPLLAQGLIREESRYNIYALSSSRAIGLMQLLPSTAMGVAKRLGVKISSHDDIHKPENNIKFGVDYLAYVLKRHDGNAMFAVASYNGGPNAVASWKRKYPLADPDYFVEYIPYTETRDYVRKVFGSYWNYQRIYLQSQTGAGEQTPAGKEQKPAAKVQKPAAKAKGLNQANLQKKKS